MENNILFVILDDEEEENGLGFDLKNDGHCVINAAFSFSYDSWTNWFGIAGYKIPLERYQEVYGDSYTKHIYNQNISTWGGNCFGMSVTAAMFYKGKLPVSNYTHDVNTLTAGGYDDMVTSSGETYLRLNKNSELTKLIERYQIWQGSNECYRSWVKDIFNYESGTYAEAFSTIVSKVKSTKEPYLVLVHWNDSSGKTVGHTLVVDSARTPKDLGNGWIRLYLYDPNNPYFEYFGEKTPALSYKQAENRFLDVNTINGQWKMAAMVNGSGASTTSIGYDDNGNVLRKSSIVFVDVNDYPTNFNTKATFSSSDDSTNISYMSDNFEVYDSNNALIYKMEDGETIYIKDDIVSDYVSYGYIDGVDFGVSEGKLVLPKGKYKVSADKGAIAYMENGDYAGVVSKDDIIVSNKDSTSLSISSTSSADVNVVIADVDSDKKYISVETDIKTDESGLDISLNNTKLDVNTEDTQNIDIDVITEDGENSIEKISSDDVTNLDVTSNINESSDAWYALSAAKSEIMVGETTNIACELKNSDTRGNVTWTSSDSSIATVSASGVVTGVKAGTVTIKAEDENGVKGSVKITVTPATITGIRFESSELTLKKDETTTLILIVAPSNAEGEIAWISSNTSVATVDASGVVTAKSAGTTTITASYEDISASVKITVTESLNNAVISAIPDQKYTGSAVKPAITVTLNGAVIDADNYSVSYKNNVNEGTATVTVTGKGCYEGKIKGTFKIVKMLPYTDVTRNDWYYDYVYDTYTKNLMTGMNATTFGPTVNLSRAQFATILYRMENEPQITYTETFPDVPNGQFFTSPVLWAYKNGVVTGYANGNFGSVDNITREQMALMLFRYASQKGYDTSEKADLSSYPDANKVSPFAKDAMEWAVAEGIISGDNGNLNPQGNTVRAVCATIVSRFVKAYE